MTKPKHETLVVNLFGGPGAGKSTMASFVFAMLKTAGINSELVSEYAKDMTWEESFPILENQIFIFGNQQHRIWRLAGKVDVIVTDAPLLNSLLYGDHSFAFQRVIAEEFSRYENVNVFLHRVKPYNQAGRSQDEIKAKEMDNTTKKMVLHAGFDFDLNVNGEESSAPVIVKYVLDRLIELSMDRF